MQTKRDIQALLAQVGASPNKRLGQCFLIERAWMDRVANLAGDLRGRSVLEVGPGTGSLSEELLDRGARLTAVEIDRALIEVLHRRLVGREGFTLVEGDVLAGKHQIRSDVLAALGSESQLVANLPYSIATSLVAECLCESWRAMREEGVTFTSLTFTVQHEVAERLAAGPGGADYGRVSVIIRLLGEVTLHGKIPPGAFWPPPKVDSQLVRVDFDPVRAQELKSLEVLQMLLTQTFTQRRKGVLKTAQARNAPIGREPLAAALVAADVTPATRVGTLTPEQFRDIANTLGEGR